MTVSTSQFGTTNFLVPAGGTTHAVGFQGGFTAQPYAIDWRQFKIDAFPFQPQGVYIDNIDGAAAVTITILPINYRIVCAAGVSIARSFPAPNGQTCMITGDPASSTTSVIFVDYPVFNEG
jgi:hypothetical protein